MGKINAQHEGAENGTVKRTDHEMVFPNLGKDSSKSIKKKFTNA